MPKISRAGVFAGLNPRQWVVLFEREEPTEDPVFNYRGVDLMLQADHLNQANVEVIIQDSVDGATWTNRLVLASAIVPGGQSQMNTYIQGRYVRVLLYSTAAGRVDGTVQIPEEQVLPGLWPDVSALACSSYCEVSSET